MCPFLSTEAGSEFADFLQPYMDELLQQHRFNNSCRVSHTLFWQKKKSGLPKNIIICHPFSTVGWSDQYAVLRVFRISAKRDGPLVHTHWLWGSVDWKASVMLYNICLEALSSLVIWMNKFMHSQDPFSPTEKNLCYTSILCSQSPRSVVWLPLQSSSWCKKL